MKIIVLILFMILGACVKHKVESFPINIQGKLIIEIREVIETEEGLFGLSKKDATNVK